MPNYHRTCIYIDIVCAWSSCTLIFVWVELATPSDEACKHRQRVHLHVDATRWHNLTNLDFWSCQTFPWSAAAQSSLDEILSVFVLALSLYYFVSASTDFKSTDLQTLFWPSERSQMSPQGGITGCNANHIFLANALQKKWTVIRVEPPFDTIRAVCLPVLASLSLHLWTNVNGTKKNPVWIVFSHWMHVTPAATEIIG